MHQREHTHHKEGAAHCKQRTLSASKSRSLDQGIRGWPPFWLQCLPSRQGAASLQVDVCYGAYKWMYATHQKQGLSGRGGTIFLKWPRASSPKPGMALRSAKLNSLLLYTSCTCTRNAGKHQLEAALQGPC